MGIEPTGAMSPWRPTVLKTAAGTSRTLTPVLGAISCVIVGPDSWSPQGLDDRFLVSRRIALSAGTVPLDGLILVR